MKYKRICPDISETECWQCGKQLWKRVFISNFTYLDDMETELEFCSKSCGKKWIIGNLDFEMEKL